MVTRISQDMISPEVGGIEIGDFAWSARTSKVGWLLCQGQEVSRVAYMALFLAIGTTFGVGDGSTTFNLPPSAGRGLIGAGDGVGLTERALGDMGGAETHQLTTGEMPAHNHGVTDPGHSHAASFRLGTAAGGLSWAYGGTADNASQSVTVVGNTTGISIQNRGDGGAHNNMPPFLAANLFIYAGV